MSSVAQRSALSAAKAGPSLGRARVSPLLRWIPPQLTQLVETAPSGREWLHEIKLDGFRMAARIEGKRPRLLTRTGLDWSGKYPSVIATLAKVRAKTVYLDGELCGVGDDGLPSFSQTQAASDGERGVRLVYYVFDLLHLDGTDTANLPLIERKALLEPLLAGISGLQFNGHELGDGEIVRKHACKLGFEGVVSKTVDAPMHPATAVCGASRNASTGRNSLSLVGLTLKDRGPISARSCSATTPTTAVSFMPAEWARGCRAKCWPACDSALSLWPERVHRSVRLRLAERASDRRWSFLACIGSSRTSSPRSPI
jgi:ATP dependent DNA ligase domain